MGVLKRHFPHALSRESCPQKCPNACNHLLDISLLKCVVLLFLTPALIISLALGTTVLQSQPMLSQETTFYGSLMQGDTVLGMVMDDLHLMPIDVQGILKDVMFSLFGVLLGIGIVGYLFSNILTRFLRQLRDVSHSVQEGQLEARLVVVGRDKIAEVGISINNMLDTIEQNTTEHRTMEQTLREGEERFRTVIANAPIILFAVDAVGTYTFSEGSGLQRMGVKPGQHVGLSILDVYRDYPLILDPLRRALTGERISTVAQIGTFYFECHLNPVYDEAHQPAGFIGVATDISEYEHLKAQQQHQAQHDTLTDLPNRVQVLEQVELAIQAMEGTPGEVGEVGVALLMMDLNHFKEVNDTFGHQYGDLLLQQVGERLKRAVRASDMVARLGGDEFAILLPIADEASIQEIANRLLNVLEEQFIVGEYPMHIDASIGAALYPAHGHDALTLLRRADVAMYTAKQAREGYVFYKSSADCYNPQRLALLGALRYAIDNDELMLYYQPKSDIKTSVVYSVEALIRWQHPTLGFIFPDQFIPLAEQTGLIVPLTRWVLEAAIRQCRDWRESGRDLCIAVNLSTWNLHEVTLPETIAALLKKYDVPPTFLRVEVTESAVMTDVERALEVLMRISALGVCISIDDFGTGYSSLAYLRRLPVDELKIDRSFVQHMAEVEADVSIVRSTVTLAHSLGLSVVAEGVEDEATWHLLKCLECDIAQGYYLSRPVSAPNLELWLRDSHIVRPPALLI